MEISKSRKGICNHDNGVLSLNYKQILFKKSTKKKSGKNKFIKGRVCNLLSMHFCKNIILLYILKRNHKKIQD